MRNNYPDSLTIRQYLEGTLDPKKAHELEKKALDDPFLADALEGYSVYGDPAADLSIMQRQLHERIVHLQENKKVFDLTWQRLSIAAAAAVMFVSAGLLFWMNSSNNQEKLASQSHKQVDVSIIDKDSVNAVVDAATAYPPAEAQSGRERLTARAVKKPVNAESSPLASEDPVIALSESSAPATARLMKAASPAAAEAVQAAAPATAQPKAGWDSYNSYLRQNTEKFKPEPAVAGSVLLSVHVAADGQLGDIRVMRSLAEAYDKEAIRIIKDGPGWDGSPDGKPVELMIEVKF